MATEIFSLYKKLRNFLLCFFSHHSLFSGPCHFHFSMDNWPLFFNNFQQTCTACHAAYNLFFEDAYAQCDIHAWYAECDVTVMVSDQCRASLFVLFENEVVAMWFILYGLLYNMHKDSFLSFYYKPTCFIIFKPPPHHWHVMVSQTQNKASFSYQKIGGETNDMHSLMNADKNFTQDLVLTSGPWLGLLAHCG